MNEQDAALHRRLVNRDPSVVADLTAQYGGQHVIYEVATGPVKRIRVRRVARQDEHGLWWVVGHDMSLKMPMPPGP